VELEMRTLKRVKGRASAKDFTWLFSVVFVCWPLWG
jgi:hypothetical protein